MCSRSDAVDLVADGIKAVWGRFVWAPDPNSGSGNVPGPMLAYGKVARFDFVLEHASGMAVRIHPGRNSHEKPVYGEMAQFMFPEERECAPVATRGRVVKDHGTGCFYQVGQSDVIGRESAQKFLRKYQSAWEALHPPRGRFHKILTEEECDFQWGLYLNTTPWGQNLLREVEKFGIAWHTKHNRPCFYFKTKHKQGIIDVLSDPPRPPSKVTDLEQVLLFT